MRLWRRTTDRRTHLDEMSKYRDLRRREFGTPGRMDLRATLNEPKLAIKAVRFMEQTHTLGQFRWCVAEEVERCGETQGMERREG